MACLVIAFIFSFFACYVGMRANKRSWIELFKSDLRAEKISGRDYLDWMEFVDAEFSLRHFFWPGASKTLENYLLRN